MVQLCKEVIIKYFEEKKSNRENDRKIEEKLDKML